MKKLFSLLILSCLFVSCTSGNPAANSAKKPSAAQQGDSSGAAALEITPGEAVRNATLSASAKGFNLSEATLVWLVNGAIVDGVISSQFRATEVVRGDTVQAKAILKDRELLSNVVTIGNTLPEITSLKLLPEVFKPGDTLNIAAAGTDADGNTVSFLYEWSKNGALAGNTSNLVEPLKRGDKISVKITPYDGWEYGSPKVIEREIRNMPPVIVEHKEFSFDGSVYTYQVKASDPDGDALAYSLESPPEGLHIDASAGLLKWMVPKDFIGTQNVSIIANDGHGGTAKYVLEIIIQ